jgi:AraC family transcriptional regulator
MSTGNNRATVGHFRLVSGQLVSSVSADATNIRIELLRRRTSGTISWQFCQPKLALFWFRRGFGRFQVNIGGATTSGILTPKEDLGLFPAETSIYGEFEGDPQREYVVVFLDRSLMGVRRGLEIQQPLIGFGHDHLKDGLAALCREAMAPDQLFDLFAEGWAMQALVHLSRLEEASHLRRPAKWRGGLSPLALRRVEEYIRSNLSEAITVAELSGVAGISDRHFLRAFRESVGATPLKYVRALRIEEAKRRLLDESDSITRIAFDCGFSQAQHFTTTFRLTTGTTPSAFRRLRLS